MSEQPAHANRKFLGVMFECCRVYARIYMNDEATHYKGCCPRCRREISFRVGEGGSNRRFWRAR